MTSIVPRARRHLPWLLLALIASQIAAADQPAFYVSPAGNDAWSGTKSEPSGRDGPFATIAKARDAVRGLKAREHHGAIMVALHGGRYELQEPLLFTAEDSGTAESPIAYVAVAGEQPLISGGRLVSNWAARDGRWTAEIPGVKGGTWYPRQLMIDGERRFRSRLPKEGFFRVAGFAGADPKAKYDTGADKFEYQPGDLLATWTKPTEIEAVVLHFWVDTHLPVATIDDASHVVTFAHKSRRRFTDDNSTTGARYYLDNVAEAIGPGEFHLDRASGVLTYLPRPGEDPAKVAAVLPTLPYLLAIEGKPGAAPVEHLAFAGLAFADTDWTLGVKDSGDSQGAVTVPGAVRLTAAKTVTFSRCRFSGLGTYGIDIGRGCREVTIQRCEFADLAGGGVKISGSDSKGPEAERTGAITVADCHLHHLGQVYHSAIGILLMHADHCALVHNHIHHLYYTGISAGWVWGYGPSVSHDNLIEGNDIHDIGQHLLSDMGGVYLLGLAPGTVVRGNRIHDVESWGYGGWGIYTDEGSSGVVIEDNLVYRTKSGGFHQHYGKDNLLRNNIFAFAKDQQLQRTRMEDHLSFTFERNIVYWTGGTLLGSNWKDDKYALDANCYWSADGKEPRFAQWSFAEWQARGKDAHSIIADPLFVDPAHDDFTLQPGSPALKLGFKPVDFSAVGPRKE